RGAVHRPRPPWPAPGAALMPRLRLSTGAVSGDLPGGRWGAALPVVARRRQLPREVVALGGPRMQAAGAQLLANTAGLG
ncbi:MAG: hypothetical protein ACK46L_12090, partial [Synechococcaceae cyanobacterium]